MTEVIFLGEVSGCMMHNSETANKTTGTSKTYKIELIDEKLSFM